jgi:signal transduction histidine kinase/Flp pilus assembly protein TadD
MYAYFICCLLLVAVCYQAAGQSSPFDSLTDKALNLLKSGQFDTARVIYQQALQLATPKKDSLGIGNALNGIGIVNDQEGKYDIALDYYFKAVHVYEKAGYTNKAAGSLKNIGNIYRVLKAYDKAHAILQQALSMQTDSTRIVKILNDIGLVYLDQDSVSKARPYFQQLITRYNRHVDDQLKANTLNNIAITWSKQGQYQEALKYYQAALVLMEKIQYRYGIAMVLNNLADLYFFTKNYKRSLEYHYRSLDTIRLIKSNQLLLNGYLNLANALYKMGNYKKAYDYLLNEMNLKDTMYKEESRQSYAEMDAKYQTEKKQTQILLLQQNNRIAQVELSSQRRAKYLLLIVSGLILIVTISLYKSYTVRKKANAALNRLNDQLKEANNSKAKLISIISHDLRSPVSSLFHFLQLQKVQVSKMVQHDQDAFNTKISQSAEHLLEAMEDLLMWSKSQMDHFKPAMETINASELLDEIIELHEPFAAGKNIILQKESVANITFDTDPNFVKIILRNLTSNAIKFTPAQGSITLLARQQDDNIYLTVKDNGPGIAEADLKTIFEWNSIGSDSSGLGLKLAREFTEKLGGKLTVSSEPGQGAAFVVCLPLAPTRQAIHLN